MFIQSNRLQNRYLQNQSFVFVMIRLVRHLRRRQKVTLSPELKVQVSFCKILNFIS